MPTLTQCVRTILCGVVLAGGAAVWAQGPDAETRRLAEDIGEKLRLVLNDEADFSYTKPEAELMRRALDDYVDNMTMTTEIVQLENARPNELAEMLQVFQAQIIPNDELMVMTVAAQHEHMPAILDAIKRLDVKRADPREAVINRNVELTVYMIEGSSSRDPGEVIIGSLPEQLEEVVNELAEVFPYETYRLVDTLFLRCRDNSEASTSGMLPVKASADQSEGGIGSPRYMFRVERVSIASDTPNRIRMDEVQFSAEMPIVQGVRSGQGQGQVFRQVSREEIGLRADIDLREGQHVVVGKAAASGDQTALFIVVSAKVVEG